MPEELENYDREERPWGSFERFTLNEQTTVKIITVSPGQAFSLQKHSRRGEFWRVLAGSGTLTIGDETHEANAGMGFFIAPETIHRAEGGEQGLVILEIAFGEFDETDIIRIEDRYGRT